MTELLTARQMRELEQGAIDAGAATGTGMMEKAGEGVVRALFTRWPALRIGQQRALILCGPGNNGGDGFVITRLLHGLGWAVDVFLSGDPAKLPADARTNYDRLEGQARVRPWDPEVIRSCPRPDVIIDAVFGTGLTRPLPEEIAGVLGGKLPKAWARGYDIRKVAVDCPSGLNLDTGHIPFAGDPGAEDFDPWPQFVNSADLTVTFHSPKPGHYLAMGPVLCGQLEIVDIGLRGEALERSMVGQTPDPERARLVAPVFMGRPMRRWPLSAIAKSRVGGHKYTYGHVAVFAGGVGRGGAGRLAARAALRAGAGLVTLVCPPSALQENACRLDAVMLRALSRDAALEMVADHRVSAFCLGPGMGVSEHTRDRVLEVLARRAGEGDWRDPAVVLDADALTSFHDASDMLFDALHPRAILTPHEGEFARLFPDLALSERRDKSKIDAVRTAAARAGCIILLKGADTVIASPEGGASLHAASYERETSWLATAGAGDVLAGLIAGLSAPGTSDDLFAVAEAAAWLHVEAALSFGPGLIAEDLPDALPAVLRKLRDQSG